MNHLITLDDLHDFDQLLKAMQTIQKNPLAHEQLGRHKTLGILFFNPSLRTRISTQKAAQNLGMQCMVMNFNNEGWGLEFEDDVIMNGTTSEHIKEAAGVLSQYFDVLAVRAFASLSDKAKDQAETVLRGFARHSTIPIINLESATAHPLQALADGLTITEFKKTARPKVVLSWAPHPKALPQAVANSFVRLMQRMDTDFVIAQPEGYELDSQLTKNMKVVYSQQEAFDGADFIYTKNWSSFSHYGQVLRTDDAWKITSEKMKMTNNAYFMHCLPVRRNVVVDQAVLESPQSLVLNQARNRIYTAQAVLKSILDEA
ncbi:MAG: N-acetylornithine carbamoyltransferase [Flavobacteriia bacterium]|nr:N-acetylornithine carbamoyltransferase [Flavobacteriia bacterium]